MPRVFDYLFSQIQRHRQKMGEDRVEYLVKCSCLEIYNERIQDLLEPDRSNLQIREDIKRGVIVEGLSSRICETANDALQLINDSARNRRVSETSMNKESSRSHLMFTLIIECRITDSSQTSQEINHNHNDNNHISRNNITKTPNFTRKRSRNLNKGKLVRTRTSRFNLVDLAGSERQSKTNATGDRLREAGNINKSLTVLGHVMKALVQQSINNNNNNDNKNNQHRHIHYRDSKLTHLLKDSLGGNSLTFMIACISPSSLNLLESLSTLQFASRAKYIKNKAQLNEDQSGSLIVLKQENRKLINEVAKLKHLMRKLKQRKQSINNTSFILSNGIIDIDHQQNDNHNNNHDDDDDDDDDDNNDKLRDTIEILERENYTIRREREKCNQEIVKMGNLIDKKQEFVMSLKMQLKLRETETIKLRDTIEQQMVDGENLRNEIIQRYEKEEKERKNLNYDASAVIEEHLKNMELHEQCEQMMDFIHRFIDDKDNKFRYDQYEKWKNTYQTLIDENEQLRQEMQSNETDSQKLLAVKEKMVQPKIEQYQIKISLLNNQIQEIEKKNKDNIDELQQKYIKLQELKQEKENEYNDLQNNYGELMSKIQLEERKYLMEKEAMKDEYEKQLENMRQGAVRALDSNNEQTMELKMQIAQLNAKMDATEKELIDSQSQCREQTKQLKIINDNLKKTNSNFNELQSNFNNQIQEIKQLNCCINDKNDDIESLKKEITEIENESNQKQILLNMAQTTQQELENKIGEKHSMINRLEAELETISQEFSDLKLEYSSLQDDHQILSDVQQTLQYQKTEIDEKIKENNKEITTLKEKINELNDEIQDKNNIIQTLKNEASEKMSNADEMVKNLNKKNENLLKTIDEITIETNGMRESLKEAQNEMLRKDIDIEALRREMQTINGQLSDYKSAHNDLKGKYSGYVNKYKEIQGKLDETQHKCDNYNTALIDKNIKLQRLIEDNQSLQNQSNKYQKESLNKIESLNDEINNLQNKIKQQQDEYNQAVQKWDSNKSEMQTIHKTEIAKKDKYIKSLQSEIVTIKQEKSDEINSLNTKFNENQRFSEQKLKEIEQEHDNKIEDLNNEIINLHKEKNKIDGECVIMTNKYENEKCKLKEKEETLELLQKKLSQFNNKQENNDSSQQIECQMSQVFEQFNNQQQKLNQEITELNKENVSLKAEIDKINVEKSEIEKEKNVLEKQKKCANEAFEQKKKNMCDQLERAHADIQLRQERSERLIKTFEQRLELRQKQNIDYREKIDHLSSNLTSKTTIIKKQIQEIEQLKDQLKRCQHTVTNAQALNETLLQEKAIFDTKIEERDTEIKDITIKHNNLQNELTKCIKDRKKAIETSQKMRIGEERAYNEMMKWQSKFNDLHEKTDRLEKDLTDSRKANDNLALENSKLAGHHNAQQRINHLLNLKKECEKLKREKKQLLNKVSTLQKKLGKTNSNLNVSSISMNSMISTNDDINESKEELTEIINKLLKQIGNIAQLSVIEDNINFELNSNNVDHHLLVLNKTQNVIHDQNNQIIKLKRDIDGLNNDIIIRNEQIKVLKDEIILTPSLQKKSVSRLTVSKSSISKSSQHRKRKRSSSYNNNNKNNKNMNKSPTIINTSKSVEMTSSKKRLSTDNFNFE